MRITVGKVNLNCEESGSGTPLFLAHGLGGDLRYWDEIVDALSEHHQVVRWDARGFGDSDRPPGPYSPELFAADLAGLLDALGIERVHFAGVSMGGVIGQRFALDHPSRLRSLTLVSTSSEVGPRARASWQHLADLLERDGFVEGLADATVSFSPSFSEVHPEVVRAMSRRIMENDPTAYAAAARAMSDYAWTADLARVATPTLILQGLEDLLTPPGGAVRMSRSLPNCRLLMLPHTGHNLPLELPLLFRTVLLAFIGAVDLTGRGSG